MVVICHLPFWPLFGHYLVYHLGRSTINSFDSTLFSHGRPFCPLFSPKYTLYSTYLGLFTSIWSLLTPFEPLLARTAKTANLGYAHPPLKWHTLKCKAFLFFTVKYPQKGLILGYFRPGPTLAASSGNVPLWPILWLVVVG